MVATRLSGMGGYEPGAVGIRCERDLRPEEWDEVDQALRAASFDTLPETVAHLGADGEQWILESARNGEYRVVDRWSPRESGGDAAFRRASETFLDLAGTDLVTGERH
jgi:hypothetical protein